MQISKFETKNFLFVDYFVISLRISNLNAVKTLLRKKKRLNFLKLLGGHTEYLYGRFTV